MFIVSSQLKMGDYRVENLFLMQSLQQPLILTSAYLLLVLKIGPYFMAKRQRFDLKVTTQVYNVLQIIFNTFYVAMSLRAIPHYNIWCSPSDPGESEVVLHIIKLHHLFVLLKIFDFLETIFFVLRKKSEQVTFLHVFHHVGMHLICWTACKYFPGGHGFVPTVLNAFVHIFMYFYYLQSSRGNIMNKLWKKCLTGLQIGHQVLVLVLYLLALLNPKCSYPKGHTAVTVGFMVALIYLFERFYQKSYSAKNLKKKRL